MCPSAICARRLPGSHYTWIYNQAEGIRGSLQWKRFSNYLMFIFICWLSSLRGIYLCIFRFFLRQINKALEITVTRQRSYRVWIYNLFKCVHEFLGWKRFKHCSMFIFISWVSSLRLLIVGGFFFFTLFKKKYITHLKQRTHGSEVASTLGYRPGDTNCSCANFQIWSELN